MSVDSQPAAETLRERVSRRTIPVHAVLVRLMKRLLLGLVVALMDDGLAGPRVATGGGGGSVRVSGWGSCDLLSLPGRVEAIQRACCANAASCADGTPDRCDATCAQAYLPFFFDCQHVLETSMQQPAGSSDDPLQSFGLLEARCSALLGAPRTLAVTGLLNSYMDGTYELEDSVNGMPHWVNRDGCHCDNCLGTACHLYWAISTPAAHCNHNCPRWTFDMDLEPNSRTASYPGSASLPPLGTAPWSEYSIRGPGRPGTRSTQLTIVADTAVPICGAASTGSAGRYVDPSGTITADSTQLITQPVVEPTGHARVPQHLCEMTISAPPGSSLTVELSFSNFHLGVGTGDSVRLYAGLDSSAPLLGEFRGVQSPGQLTSPSGDLHLVFATAASTETAGIDRTGQGWSAYWSMTVGAPCPLDAVVAPAGGTRGTCAAGSAADPSDADKVLLPGESCNLQCADGATIAYSSRSGGDAGAPACIAGKWTTNEAVCVDEAPPSRLRLGGLCNEELNRVYILSGTYHGKPKWTSPNGYQLYYSSECCGSRWFLDSDLDDSHSIASLPLHGAAVDIIPTDGARWQVYCENAWVMSPVSVEVIVDHCTANPCQHSGRCVEQADGYVCLCAPGTSGMHCELETCSSQKVSELQRIVDGACCSQQLNARCTKPVQPDGSGTALFALPDSCSSPDCAVAVAAAFAQCERRIYDAQVGGAGLSAFQEVLASCQSGH